MKITPMLLTNPKVIGPIESEKKNITWHWIGNAGTNATANRNWMNSEDNASNNQVSCTFIVGLYGECLQLLDEMRKPYTNYGVYNNGSITVEVCHPDWTGEFTKETYRTMVELGAYICKKYNFDPLNPKEFMRHYDHTGKECPRWFVVHPEAWEQFKRDVKAAMAEDISSIPLSVLVSKTLEGAYGNGADRKAALGSRYDEVQNAINNPIKVVEIPTKPVITTGNISETIVARKANDGFVGIGENLKCIHDTMLFSQNSYMPEYKMADIKVGDTVQCERYIK